MRTVIDPGNTPGPQVLSGDNNTLANYGTIVGPTYGVSIAGVGDLLTNGGTVFGATNGVYLARGGTIANLNGGTITGYDAIISNADLTLDNHGVIAGNNTVPTGHAIYLSYGTGLTPSTITNESDGLMSGYAAIKAVNAVTIANHGTIAGSSVAASMSGFGGYGVILEGATQFTTPPNSYLYNATDGTISGATAVYVGAGDTVVNAGQIQATAGSYFGVAVYGGSVTNLSTGTITSVVQLTNGGPATIVNAGTIGNGATAVAFQQDSPNNRLVIDPGAVFLGTVGVGGGTLELAGGASAGVLSGLGSKYGGFTQIVVDSGATWQLDATDTVSGPITNAGTLITAGSVANGGVLVNNGKILLQSGTFVAGSLSGTGTIAFGSSTNEVLIASAAAVAANTIANMAAGQTIELLGQTLSAANILAGNTLQLLIAGGGEVDLKLDPSQSFFGDFFHATNNGGNSFITEDTTPCFLAGTRILTERGEVPVETLTTADRVVLAAGGSAAIQWIGHRSLDLSRHKSPKDAQPIAFRPGALADGIPTRTLLVSPEHGMALGGGLVPARLLVNGTSIQRDDSRRWVHYYHIELARHAILLAEGAPSESYLDTGNRGQFDNGDQPLILHPDFRDGQAGRVGRSCAPFLDAPADVRPIWQQLAERAAMLGFASPEPAARTADPALTLRSSGRSFHPIHRSGDIFTFVLPALGDAIEVMSRTAAPADTQPWLVDQRTLGVAIRRIELRRGDEVEAIALDHPALMQGWWAAEDDGRTLWRWTDGAAVLPVRPAGATIVTIETCGGIDYAIGAGLALAA